MNLKRRATNLEQAILDDIERPPQGPSLSEVLENTNRDVGTLVPAEYVPPKNRTAEMGRITVKAVNSFAELPTSELDGLISGLESKLAEIKNRAAAIKSDYMARTTELREAVERLNKACLHGESKMNEIHTGLNDIYQPGVRPPATPVAEEPTHES